MSPAVLASSVAAMAGMTASTGATGGAGMTGGAGVSGMSGMPHMTGPMWMPMTHPTASNLLAFHLQPIPVFPIACALALALYVTGLVRLHRRGDSWPITRTAAFVFGLVTVVMVTGTGIGGYGMRLLSVHMIQHMVLSMLSPIFILLGAPITLALRVLPEGGTAPTACCCGYCTAASRGRSRRRGSPSRCS